MKLEIVSPDGILFEGETESVSFPGVAGSFDILPHHAPLIAALKAGTIRFEANGKRQEQTIQSGFVEVKDDILSVCVEYKHTTMNGRLKMRLMGLITFINVAIGVSLGGLLYTIWPEHYFSWYPSIPFFYWVMAMAMTFFLDRVKRKNGDVTVTMYMLVRLCKFTLAFVFLWMYAAFVGQQLKTFGFTLMLFYFIYLGLETYILYLFEKKRMKREKREKDDEYNQR